MLTLSEMQQTSTADLEALAVHEVGNAQYARALNQMMWAQKAYAVGDIALMNQHVEACKIAYKRACEDEAGRVRRAREMNKLVSAQGNAQSATVAGGKSVVKLGMSKVALWDLSWGTR